MDENPSTSSGHTGPDVPRPTRFPYINFVQHFRQTFEGPRPKPQEMVRLAAAAWREMTDDAKLPFQAIADREKVKPRPKPAKVLKRLESLRPRRPKAPEEKAAPARRRAVKPKGKAKGVAAKVKGVAAKRKTKRSRSRPKRKPKPALRKRRARSRESSDSGSDGSTRCSDSDCSMCY